MDSSSLVLGKTYFRVTFADRDLTMPGIEPMVFIGCGELSDGGAFVAFQDTISYVQFGSRLAPGAEEREDQLVMFVAPEEIGESVLDLPRVLALVEAAHGRAVQLNYPVLPSNIGRFSNAT